MTRDSQPDPEVMELLEKYDKGAEPLHKLSVEDARNRQLESLTQGNEASESVANVRDIRVDIESNPISARIYEPEGTEQHPLVIFLHGGGWVLGNLESHDALCRALTNRSDATVLSVDYRLAPEHPFPAALHDCYGMVEWAVENSEALQIDPDRVALAGVSAGGNLAAAVTQFVNDFEGPKIVQQTLMCPVTDYEFSSPSFEENGEGYLLSEADIRWCWDKYLSSPFHRKNPYVSPLASSDLEGLPRTTLITAEFDPLRDQGQQYANSLTAAGVPVNYVNYEGMIHGFMSRLTGPFQLSQAWQTLTDIGDDFKQVFDS